MTEEVITVQSAMREAAISSTGRGRSGIGISTKLQAAFGVVAALTVIAAAVAIVSFSAIERGFKEVAGQQVPLMTDALGLSIISSDISAAAARFVSAKTADDQKATSALIERNRRELAAVMERVRTAGGDSRAFAELVAVSQRLAANLTALEETISERSEFSTRLQARLDAVHKSRAEISEQLAPISELRNVLEVSAQIHVIISLLSEGSIVKEAAFLAPIQERFKTASDVLAKATATLTNEGVRKAVAVLVEFGKGADSVFALRARELYTSARADGTIDENVAIQHELESAVSALVREAKASMQQGTEKLIDDLGRNRALLLIVAIASLLAAAAIGTFYVQRRLVRRLIAIGDAMRRLSSGDVDLKIPTVAERDEIGEMARSLEVFRASEIERRRLAEREQQVAQRKRAATVDEIIGEFRATLTAIIGAVSDNLARMKATAGTLSAIAGKADQQARAVSLSSETMSSNVRTVAGATDQLGASIGEISQQAAQARGVVQRATEIARSADQMVGQLSDGADRIGDVVKLIRAIAEQTNLLALNATIEAARAGEAGRGFAVVASEVKTLASQTARATENIASHVHSIQNSTAEAVGSIRSISEVMEEISRFTVTIAGAVEVQSSSTEEIAHSVAQAAKGANELAGNMLIVTESIDETNRSASAVHEASNALSTQASSLQNAVDVFLRRVSAA